MSCFFIEKRVDSEITCKLRKLKNMSPFLNEKIFIFTPIEIVENVSASIRNNNPFVTENELHSFLSWGLLKAFKVTSGIEPVNYFNSISFEAIYREYSGTFEQFMFRIVRDIGAGFKDNTRYNLVLTHERLYIITF